jgi:archaeal cell division control protein 6
MYEDLLNQVFDRFLKGPRLFKNREVLRPDYVPNELPHREEQIQHIGGILVPVLKGSRSSNIFIYGQTGTGKTAVVKFILDKLIRKSQEIEAPIITCYVNCRLTGTDYRVFSKLCEVVNTEVPFTGLATNEVFDRFKIALDFKKVLLIVVLDEIDFLVKERGDDLLYDLTRINENLKLSRVSIIGISNDLQFKENLDARVLSSLSEEEVVFRPYSATELYDILQARSVLGFLDHVLAKGALNLCSALAASEHGDARRALDLLRVAGELAEREGATKVTEEYVRIAQNKIEEDRITSILKTLPLHSKLVLCSCYLLKQADYGGAITGNVYEVYYELCNQIQLESLTQRRVSGLISELDIMGILNASVINLGRYGRTKKIKLGISEDVVKDIFLKDEWISSLISYHPHCLMKAESKS